MARILADYFSADYGLDMVLKKVHSFPAGCALEMAKAGVRDGTMKTRGFGREREKIATEQSEAGSRLRKCMPAKEDDGLCQS